MVYLQSISLQTIVCYSQLFDMSTKRKTLLRLTLCALLIFLPNCTAAVDSPKKLTVAPSEPTVPSPNRQAFLWARLAATAKSWDAATKLLESIDLGQVDDMEVIEYVQFSELCVRTAEELGVDRQSNPDHPTDIVTRIAWEQLIATLAEKAVRDPAGGASLLSDARKVQTGIRRYQELDSKLLKEYGTQ